MSHHVQERIWPKRVGSSKATIPSCFLNRLFRFAALAAIVVGMPVSTCRDSTVPSSGGAFAPKISLPFLYSVSSEPCSAFPLQQRAATTPNTMRSSPTDV